jgi:hypothetical protein
MYLQITPEIPVKLHSLFIIEPVLYPEGINLSSMVDYLTTITYTRRDVWPTRTKALNDLSAAKGFRNWDKGILALYVVSSICNKNIESLLSSDCRLCILATRNASTPFG